MSFNTQNAFVGIVVDDVDQVFGNPATNLTAGKIKVVGVCKSDTGFDIKPDQTERTSYGDELVLSYKSEIDLKLLSRPSNATKDLMETQKTALVFIDPKQWNISQEDLLDNIDLTVAHNKVTPFSYIILAPQVLRIEEQYKFGTGKIVEIPIKSTLIAETKDELMKEFITG